MEPHFGMRGAGPFALAAALVLSICSLATSCAFAEESVTLGDASAAAGDRGDSQSVRAPATFFTINAVLAKLDAQRTRRADAVRLAALTHPSSVTDTPPEHGPASAAGTEPFGLFIFRAPDGVLWRKWRAVEGDMAKDQAVLDHCRSDAATCPPHAAQFLRLINAVKSKSGRARLEEANQGVNMAIRYVSDLAQFGELDRWSAPLASFATAKGDCEDYAIAKYAALREAGFPQGDLRLLLVRDRSVGLDHAVLAARLDGHWLILDNRWSELKEDSAKLNFTPLFAIDQAGVHMFAAPFARAQPVAREIEANPAAQAGGLPEWSGTVADFDAGTTPDTHPLLM